MQVQIIAQVENVIASENKSVQILIIISDVHERNTHSWLTTVLKTLDVDYHSNVCLISFNNCNYLQRKQRQKSHTKYNICFSGKVSTVLYDGVECCYNHHPKILSVKKSSLKAVSACQGHYCALDTEREIFSYLKSAHILMLSILFLLPLTGDFLNSYFSVVQRHLFLSIPFQLSVRLNHCTAICFQYNKPFLFAKLPYVNFRQNLQMKKALLKNIEHLCHLTAPNQALIAHNAKLMNSTLSFSQVSILIKTFQSQHVK